MRLAAALLLAIAGAAHGEPFTITLSPPMQQVFQGELPRFEVEVRAKERARIVDFARRPDLAERLVRPRLAERGAMDDMPFELSEMGPVGEADYVVLEPGATMRFTSRGEPFSLGVLAPGEYTLYLRFRADFPSPIVESSRAKFSVVPPKGETR